jgi:hypothetical protein
VFSGKNASAEPMRAIRTARYKYIRRYTTQRTLLLANCDDSVSKEALLREGWHDHLLPEEMLFDLAHDPNEAANLAAAPEYREITQQLGERLTAWMHRTGDPLLAGRVPIWPGMTLNPDENHSAEEAMLPAESLLDPCDYYRVREGE